MRAALLFCAMLPLCAEVSFDRLLHAEEDPGWLTYSGTYNGQRYSRLTQINTGNAYRLRPLWVHQSRNTRTIETSPIVADGVMYVTEPGGSVTALDVATARPLWRYRRAVPSAARGCCGDVNRGVAILNDMIYVGTFDAHLVALDMRSGIVRWDVELADMKLGYSMTAAPLAVKDKIIVGIAGGDFGIRGFIDAYDARTGQRAWRFWTVPAKGDPGSETWAADSAAHGSAAPWVTGAYDPEQNLLYWGTGNPGPDWNGDVRAGDNLFSNCLLALDADSGKLKWYFQFTPHDVHDWDAAQVPVLADLEIRGVKRKVALFANRNGFYYVLDRVSGKFLAGRQYVKQTWAQGLDESGRPIVLPGTDPTSEGIKVFPDSSGGTNWFSPSLSLRTNLFYVCAREAGGLYVKRDAEYVAGARYEAGRTRHASGEHESGAIRALVPATGEVKWEFRLYSDAWAGVLTTAGNLVFGSSNEGDFFALDAVSGRVLWRFQTGGRISANPVTYLSEGRQQIAIAAGNSIFAFGLDQ